jgi:hypothetical protein
MVQELASMPTVMLDGAESEPALIAQEGLELPHNRSRTSGSLTLRCELAEETEPAGCGSSQVLPAVDTGSLATASPKRAPAVYLIPNDVDGYMTPAGEIGLKNNGE